jgi:hypothetical protein
MGIDKIFRTYVCMRCPRNILRARTVLNGKNSLRDHLTCVRTDNMYTEQLVGFLLRYHLNLTFGVEVGLRTRVGREREFTDVVLDAGSLELLLILTDPRNLRVRVDNGWYGMVVDVTMAGLDELNCRNA